MELSLALVIPAAVGAIGVIYILYVAACTTEEELEIHNLRVQTMQLRNNYARQLAERRGGTPGTDANLVGVDIEDEAPSAEAA